MSINSYDDEATIRVKCPDCQHSFNVDIMMTVEMYEPEINLIKIKEK